MRIDNAIDRYIDYRRNAGSKFESIVRIFNVFSKHFGKETLLSSISRQACMNFLYEKASCDKGVTSYWYNLYSALDGLFGWALVRELIKENPLPIEKPDRPQAFVPYIYAILMLTYFLGLRPGETLKIEISDVHLGDENYILIKDAKYYKSRFVPFNNQVAMFLEEFMLWRKDRGLPSNPESKLFLDRFFYPYSLSAMDVVSWYKEKKNVQDLLPVLSTYLGHSSINSTAVYISFTDCLLREASNRFESYLF